MSQLLQKMTRKDGKAKGVANRLHDSNRNHLTIDGILYDTADCSSHRIWCVWEIKD